MDTPPEKLVGSGPFRLKSFKPDLATLMEEDPVGYACHLARAIPGLGAHLTLPPEELAGLVRRLYGRLERTERTLWAIWGRTPNDSR